MTNNTKNIMTSKNGNFLLRRVKGVPRGDKLYTILEVISLDHARKHMVDIRLILKKIYTQRPPVDEYKKAYIYYSMNNNTVKSPLYIEFTEHLQSIIDDNGGTISSDYFDDKEMEK